MISGGSVTVKVVPLPNSSTTDNVTRLADCFSSNSNYHFLCDMVPVPVPVIPMALHGNTASGLGPRPRSTMKQKPSVNVDVNMNLNLQQQIPVIDLTTPENEIPNILPRFQIQDGDKIPDPAVKQTKELSARERMILKLEARARHNLKEKAEKENSNSEQTMRFDFDLHPPPVNMNLQNHVQQHERKSSKNGKVRIRTTMVNGSPKRGAEKDQKNKKDKKIACISTAPLKIAKTTSKPGTGTQHHPGLRLLNSENFPSDPVISKTTEIDLNLSSFLHGDGTAIGCRSMTFHSDSDDEISAAVSNFPPPTFQTMTMGSLVDAAMAEMLDVGAPFQTVVEVPRLDEPPSVECVPKPNGASRQDVASTSRASSMPQDAYVINGQDYYCSYYGHGPACTNDPSLYFDDPTKSKPPVLSTTNDSQLIPLNLLDELEISECLGSLEQML